MTTPHSNDPLSDRELDSMLDELHDIDPPPTLVDTIMMRIARGNPQGSGRRTAEFNRGGRIMGKKVLWSVAAAAAVLLVIMKVTGYPPVNQGTEGTIGAAQRYVAPQIANQDVKLQDIELQAFMQTDTFRKLAADKAAREALTNKDFQRAVSDAAVRAALANPNVQSALASQQGQQALAALGAANWAFAGSAVQQALASSAVQNALATPAVAQALATPALLQALAAPAFVQALASSAAMQVLASSAATQALGSASGAPGAIQQ
jgi:hypothetical protein